MWGRRVHAGRGEGSGDAAGCKEHVGKAGPRPAPRPCAPPTAHLVRQLRQLLTRRAVAALSALLLRVVLLLRRLRLAPLELLGDDSRVG